MHAGDQVEHHALPLVIAIDSDCVWQVLDLNSAVSRLSTEKVDLERQFEMEVRTGTTALTILEATVLWASGARS